MKELTHTDEKGKAKMVDVSQKPDQEREAIAKGFIRLQPETVELIRQNQIKKGDVFNQELLDAKLGGMPSPDGGQDIGPFGIAEPR